MGNNRLTFFQCAAIIIPCPKTMFIRGGYSLKSSEGTSPRQQKFVKFMMAGIT